MVIISIKRMEKLIYPVGFYQKKSKAIHSISKNLIYNFGGKVPSNEQDLLSIKWIGRKTVNLVLGDGFGIPSICVDTHVHRISNRLGIVKTKSLDETEDELKKILPQSY